MTRPTIGRIVILHDVGGIFRPCIVLRVGVVTDVCDVGVFGELGYGILRDVPQGQKLGCWSWPAKV